MSRQSGVSGFFLCEKRGLGARIGQISEQFSRFGLSRHLACIFLRTSPQSSRAHSNPFRILIRILLIRNGIDVMSGHTGRQMSAHIRRVVGGFLLNTARRKPDPTKLNITSRSIWNSCRPESSTLRISPTSQSPTHGVITRRFATGGLFALGITPNSSISEATVTTCSTIIEKRLCGGASTRARRHVSHFVKNSSRRNIHNSAKRRSTGKKNESSAKGDGTARESKSNGTQTKGQGPSQKPANEISTQAGVMSESSKMFYERFQNINQLHRPTRDELLAAATGFWSRLKIRFKWFSIRSLRPFNADDISAFFSWVLLGHVIWILVGTTTFFSLGILALNTVFAQGKL
jgi:distribution and morphology protein 31